jgi:hypothetical protein
MLKNLIPKIFYDHLQDGLEFFVDGLGFEVQYQDADMAVIARDDVDGLFKEMSRRAPHLLHPNSSTVALKPWGSREFAMLDKTTVCVNFRDWPETRTGD